MRSVTALPPSPLLLGAECVSLLYLRYCDETRRRAVHPLTFRAAVGRRRGCCSPPPGARQLIMRMPADGSPNPYIMRIVGLKRKPEADH